MEPEATPSQGVDAEAARRARLQLMMQHLPPIPIEDEQQRRKRVAQIMGAPVEDIVQHYLTRHQGNVLKAVRDIWQDREELAQRSLPMRDADHALESYADFDPKTPFAVSLLGKDRP